MSRVIYSLCLTVQEARLWIQSWNWWRYLHGALSPFCLFCKGGSCSNSLSSPLREQSNHRGKEAQNASPSTAVECFASGIHDPNPPVQECCPILGSKSSTDRAKGTSFPMNSQTLPIQKDRGEKGSKMETWKEVPLPALKGQNLKARSISF